MKDFKQDFHTVNTWDFMEYGIYVSATGRPLKILIH